jgi:hypothetical protein
MWARNLLFIAVVVGGLGSLAGGLFPAHFAPRVDEPRVYDLPPPEYRSLVEPINADFRQQWTARSLTPAERVADLTIARRLALALTGTVPSLEEIRKLEALPPGQRVDQQLAALFRDRRYADYFAERLARTFVGTEDGPFVIFRRRRFVSWLSDELMQNRPYDQTVRELIVGEGLWTDKPATNFVTVTIDPTKNEPDPERLAARVARAFLGIRLDCAQCHDHPFQQWKQADFQGLAAYFGQVHPGFTGIHDGDGEYRAARHKKTTPEVVTPCVPFHAELLPADGPRRQQLAHWVTDPHNTAFALATANRMWALLFGRPLVTPVDDLGSTGEPPHVLRLLAEDFAGHGYDLQRLIRVIAATEIFQLDSCVEPDLTEAHEQTWAAFPLTRLRPEQVAGAIFQSASLETINRNSHIFTRILTAAGENDFVQRYGDMGEDEFTARGGTIPQRLLLMNGQLVHNKTEEGFLEAASLISMLAPDDHKAIETAYLTVLTRRPTSEEAAHFEARLAGSQGDERKHRLSDLFWTLVNATEFSWNH